MGSQPAAIIAFGLLIALFLAGVVYVELRVRRSERKEKARRKRARLADRQQSE